MNNLPPIGTRCTGHPDSATAEAAFGRGTTVLGTVTRHYPEGFQVTYTGGYTNTYVLTYRTKDLAIL